MTGGSTLMRNYVSGEWVASSAVDSMPVLNPATGDPSLTTQSLDVGEDFNGNTLLDRWGETPHLLSIQQADWAGYNPTVANSFNNELTRPWTSILAANAAQARMNRQVLFRRALKLVRGNIGIDGTGVTSMPANGLTVAST